jgi:acyl-CoA thioesterase-2
MHAYFLRAGSSDMPVIYDVDPIRDGGSFTTRRVVARQKGRAIFNCSVSFHKQEPGYEHSIPAIELPPIPTEEDVERIKNTNIGLTIPEDIVKSVPSNRSFDLVPVGATPFLTEAVTEPKGQFWFRCNEDLPDDIQLHRGALAFASDLGLLTTALFPHPTSIFNFKQMMASLDHAIWIHNDCNVNNWLLFQTDSPWGGNARGFTRGLIYSANGELIASAAQEGLVRPLKKTK